MIMLLLLLLLISFIESLTTYVVAFHRSEMFLMRTTTNASMGIKRHLFCTR